MLLKVRERENERETERQKEGAKYLILIAERLSKPAEGVRV